MSRYSLESVLDAQAAIARSALDPTTWEATLDSIAATVGGVRVAFSPIFATDGYAGLVALSRSFGDPDVMARFPERIYREDVYLWSVVDALPHGLGEVRAFAASERSVRDSEMYADWLRPLGLAPDPGLICAFGRDGRRPNGGFALYREAGRAPFDAEEVAFVEALSPFLTLATEICCLGSSRVPRLDGGPAHPVGLGALDQDGRLVWANAELDSILRRGQGLRLNRGRPWAKVHDSNTALQKQIEQALRGFAMHPGLGGVRIRSIYTFEGPGGPLRGLALPLKREPAALGPRLMDARALLWVRQLDYAAPSLERVLNDELKLAPREAQVACLRATGLRPSQIGPRIGCSSKTARNHLDAASSKLGVRGSIELCQVLLRLASFLNA